MDLIICSQKRTGSTLLGTMLGQVGLVGACLEAFDRQTVMPNVVFPRTGHGGLDEVEADVAAYVARLRRAFAAPGKPLALKLHWEHMEHWQRRGLDLDRHFPQARYVFCTRGDVVMQAISLVKANQTLSFVASQAPQAEPAYSFEAIDAAVNRIMAQVNAWQDYFRQRGITPLRVTYESLSRDRQAALRAVAPLLGVAVDEEVLRRLEPELEIQRDGVNAAWRARYVADLTRRQGERARSI